jgi:hypothetical protein
MNKRMLFTAIVLLIGAGMAIAAPAGKPIIWTGIVTDDMCGASSTKADCVTECVKDHGAKYAFLESKSQNVYVLNPQSDAAAHAGQTVVVKGTLDEGSKTITATSITAQPDKGGK